jgi:pimeloyl-ACP methyl ester carboxylesterase
MNGIDRVDAVFLPGILMTPASRYEPLLAALGVAGAVTKELEVYAAAAPASSYSMQTEIDGLHRFADAHRLRRFHLYGHSAGASIALAYVAQHGERVASLALDEPASDFSPQDRAALNAELPADLAALPVPERMRTFGASLVRPGVVLPEPPPPSPESAARPAGVAAFHTALFAHELPPQAYAEYVGPVLYTYGSLSNARWEAMATRLEGQFRSFRVERFDGLHHLHTSHVAEPQRVAAALRELWTRSAGSQSGPA